MIIACTPDFFSAGASDVTGHTLVIDDAYTTADSPRERDTARAGVAPLASAPE